MGDKGLEQPQENAGNTALSEKGGTESGTVGRTATVVFGALSSVADPSRAVVTCVLIYGGTTVLHPFGRRSWRITRKNWPRSASRRSRRARVKGVAVTATKEPSQPTPGKEAAEQ